MCQLIKNNVRVSWVDLDEGWNGYYDPDDPEDERLLRFDIDKFEDGLWSPVDDSSYCTRVSITTRKSKLYKLLNVIMEEVFDDIQSGISIKKKCKRLSWIEEENPLRS
jgi:hypothetical protein